jgi:hypothetical protein
MANRVRPRDDDDRDDPRIPKEMKLLEELEEGLQIDEHALDEALQSQPDLFYRVSKQLAILTSRRDAAKQGVTLAEADAQARIRRERSKNDEKVTDKAVEADVRRDKEVERAQQEFLTLNSMVGQYGALKEAFQQRSYVLKDLCGLYVANYYADNTGSNSPQMKMRDIDAREARRKMADVRNERMGRDGRARD